MEDENKNLVEKFLSEIRNIEKIENIVSLENFLKEARMKFYCKIEEYRKENESLNKKIFSLEEQMIREITQSPFKTDYEDIIKFGEIYCDMMRYLNSFYDINWEVLESLF